jgi:hypothetical protein
MAIKINGTTVIDDARELANIASLDAATVATLIASLGSLMSNIDTFTASGTFTVPTGVTKLSVIVIGGGGGGTKYSLGNDNSIGSVSEIYGGMGGVSYANLTVTPGASLTVVVGSAGNGNTSNFGAGTNGGDSTFQGQTGGGGLTAGTSGSATRAVGLLDTAALARCTTDAQEAIFTAAYKTSGRPSGQSSSGIAYSAAGDYVPGAGGAAGYRTTTNDGNVGQDVDSVGGVSGVVFIIY